MSDSKVIHSVVTDVGIQAVMTAVIVMKEADTGPIPGTNTASSRKACRQRHSSFEKEVVNILQTKTCKVA